MAPCRAVGGSSSGDLGRVRPRASREGREALAGVGKLVVVAHKQTAVTVHAVNRIRIIIDQRAEVEVDAAMVPMAMVAVMMAMVTMMAVMAGERGRGRGDRGSGEKGGETGGVDLAHLEVSSH